MFPAMFVHPWVSQMKEEYRYKEITEKIIGAAFTVHNELGYGFLEKVYKNALIIEIRSAGNIKKSRTDYRL